MSWSRLVVLPSMACVVLLVNWPLGLRLTPPAPVAGAATFVPGSVDPNAVEALDRALERYRPENLSWLETTLWQRAHVKELNYEASGRYLAGPGQRFRIDLTTRVGSTEGALCVVSDGRQLWKASRVAADEWKSVDWVEVPRVLQALPGQVSAEQVRSEFLQGQSFGGIHPLLQRLRGKLTWVRKERVNRKGRELLKLTGVWNAETVRAMATDGGPWPDGQPRQCRLYLEPETLWPFRIEWWGPDSTRGVEVLLLQMEFREPRINQPPADQGAQAFTFAVEQRMLRDQTVEIVDRLRPRPEP